MVQLSLALPHSTWPHHPHNLLANKKWCGKHNHLTHFCLSSFVLKWAVLIGTPCSVVTTPDPSMAAFSQQPPTLWTLFEFKLPNKTWRGALGGFEAPQVDASTFSPVTTFRNRVHLSCDHHVTSSTAHGYVGSSHSTDSSVLHECLIPYEAIRTYVRTYVCIQVCTLANHEACPGTGSKVDWSTHTHSHTVWTYLHTYTRLHVHIRMFVGRWIQWPANNSRNVYRSTHQERNSWHKLQALVVIQAESPAFSEAKKCFSPLQMAGFMQPPVKLCEVS